MASGRKHLDARYFLESKMTDTMEEVRISGSPARVARQVQ
jgi:hypothetical protein